MKRTALQHLSMMRMSFWYLLKARDTIGHTSITTVVHGLPSPVKTTTKNKNVTYFHYIYFLVNVM